MVYPVNPTNVNSPTDLNGATQGAEEFRALKAYIAGLAGLGTGINPYRRNIFTNGDLSIDQRNEGTGVLVGAGAYIADRLWFTKNAASTVNVQRVANSYKFIPLAHHAQINITVLGVSGAAEGVGAFFIVPGHDMANYAWGSIGAMPLTLSLWINSPVSGLHALSFRNAAGTRSYIATVNLVAGVNQYCQVTVPGCTDGVWSTDVSSCLIVSIDFGSGINWNAPASGAWVVGNFIRTASCVKVIELGVSSIFIGGIQLEQSNAASPLEIPTTFQERLLRNQPYFYKTFQPLTVPAQNVGSATGAIEHVQILTAGTNIFFERLFPVVMRTTPSMIFYNPFAANALPRNLVRTNDCGAVTNFVTSQLSISVSATASVGSAGNDYNFLHVTANADFF